MTGDFSRIRFDASKGYTAVLERQGRVRLDADANEGLAIEDHLRRTEIRDVVGEFGGPEDDCGFAITVEGSDIHIGAGRYYVDGLLVELPEPVTYDTQTFLVEPGLTSADLLRRLESAGDTGSLQMWLEVWQRVVSPLDDPCLTEPALGQADTTLRLQTVARVVGRLAGTAAAAPAASFSTASAPSAGQSLGGSLLRKRVLSDLMFVRPAAGTTPSAPASGAAPSPTEAAPVQPDCCDAMYKTQVAASTGKLSVTVQTGADSCGCEPVWSGGYLGLENQLYRVEVHIGGTLEQATFKWSRENGSVVFAVTGVQGQVIQLDNLWNDANLGVAAGDWVELTDDTYLFGETPNQPGTLYAVQSVDEDNRTVTVTTTVVSVDPSRNARLRRWDQTGSGAGWRGVPASGLPVMLEDGIEVSFSAGTYASGDFWTIPARSATGALLWPPCGGDPQQSPGSMQVFAAPLACLRLNDGSTQAVSRPRSVLDLFVPPSSSPFTVSDCRKTFPPLTELASNVMPPALHVSATSWKNDTAMTVDQFMEAGLSVTLDAAPTCPWSGANFQVTLEIAEFPFSSGQIVGRSATTIAPMFRQVYTLEAPEGITVAGGVVTWLTPAGGQVSVFERSLYYLASTLNQMLAQGLPTGTFGRLRVRLPGTGVYAAAQTGTLYLDGLALGTGGVQSNMSLTMPTGTGEQSSDFESWLYLSPSLTVASVTVNPNFINYNEVSGFGAGVTLTNAQGQPVGSVIATVLLNYAPAADTVVTFSLTGTGAGQVVSIPATATVKAGTTDAQVTLSLNSNPGDGVTDAYSLAASVSGVLGARWSTPATFSIMGHFTTVVR